MSFETKSIVDNSEEKGAKLIFWGLDEEGDGFIDLRDNRDMPITNTGEESVPMKKRMKSLRLRREDLDEIIPDSELNSEIVTIPTEHPNNDELDYSMYERLREDLSYLGTPIPLRAQPTTPPPDIALANLFETMPPSPRLRLRATHLAETVAEHRRKIRGRMRTIGAVALVSVIAIAGSVGFAISRNTGSESASVPTSPPSTTEIAKANPTVQVSDTDNLHILLTTEKTKEIPSQAEQAAQLEAAREETKAILAVADGHAKYGSDSMLALFENLSHR